MRPNGRSFRGGGGSGRGGFKRQDFGPPQNYEEIGLVETEGRKYVLCKLTHKDIPYINASVYNESHAELGKVDEVLGRIDAPKFTVLPMDNLRSDSIPLNQKMYIDARKLASAEKIAANEMPRGKRGGKVSGRGLNGRGGFSRGGSRGKHSGRGSQSFNARGGSHRGGYRGGAGRGAPSNRFQRPGGNRPFRGGRPPV
ncbi:hypothetical protein Aperf_G00000085946 [Anoplocephala perfoliata]